MSTVPAELIATDGKVQFVPIQGTGLLFASNTPGRLFLLIDSQKYFALLSGRWFEAGSLSGPWAYVAPDKLPPDFAKIPPGSQCDDVLANVAGTIPAREAIYDAQIPQMAEVDRSEATSQVEYDGNPQYEPIQNTDMDYVVNASTAVVRVKGRYYDCDRGVWFESGDPYGPWVVCTAVPDAIYTIPPQCPIYNVRYVRVYRYTPDVVYVGYTAGYTGCYVYNHTVVYGTGYNYHRWYRNHYYARPLTWGFGIHYEPWSGWAFGAGWWQPQGWIGYHSRTPYGGWWGPREYEPSYRTTARPAYRNGYHPADHRENVNAVVANVPREGRRLGGVTRSTLYDLNAPGIRRPVVNASTRPTRPTTVQISSPSTGTGVRPSNRPVIIPSPRAETQPTNRPTPASQDRPEVRTPNTPAPQARPAQVSSPPQPATRPTPPENNVYAAPDGTILRKTQNGWQQREQNTWKNASAAPVKPEVRQDSEVRQRAAERTASFRAPEPARQAPPQARPAPPPKENPRKDDKRR